jgi:O-antigen ligase
VQIDYKISESWKTMLYVSLLDKIIVYLILIFALCAGVSRGGLNLSAALLTVAVIVRYIYAPFRINIEPHLLRSMLLFFSAIIVSTILSSNVYASLDILCMSILRIAVFFAVLCFVRNERTINQIICLLAISLFFGSLVAIWQGLHGVARAKSFLGIMNFGGAVALIVPILLTYGFSFSKSKFLNPYLLLTTVGVASVALLYNGTRGALLASVVCLVLYLIIIGRRNFKVMVIGSMLVVALIVIIFNNSAFSKRVMYIAKPSTDVNIVARINMWGFAYKVFENNPIFGTGLGALPAYNYDEKGVVFPIEIERKFNEHWHVHNNFIQVLAENGIIGLVSFCSLFGTILFYMIRHIKQEEFRLLATAGFLCTVSFLVHGLSDYTFDIGTEIYTLWYLLGFIYAGINVVRNTA